MTKLIIYISFIFVFLNSPIFSQNTAIWRGYVSYQNGVNEADEQVCDIVKNGQLRIEPALSNQATYWSNFLYKDTICISRDFSYEVRLKNGNINLLSNECKFGFFSKKHFCLFFYRKTQSRVVPFSTLEMGKFQQIKHVDNLTIIIHCLLIFYINK